MFWLTNILLFLSGVAAASNFLAVRFPKWKNNIIKVNSFKGIIGFIVLLMGVGLAVDYLLWLKYSLKFTNFLNVLLMLALGLIQGLAILKQIVGEGKMFNTLNKARNYIVKYEEIIGLVAAASALIAIITYIF